MINQLIERKHGTSRWVLNPVCLIDRMLDHIEKLSGFVAPAKAATSYADAEIEARLEQFRT